MGSVYRLVFPNGKVYIGATRWSAEKRFRRHVVLMGKLGFSLRPLYRALKKYGVENVEVETLVESGDWAWLKQKEIEFIRLHHSTEKEHGYNLTHGGEGRLGMKQSKKQKQAMRDLWKRPEFLEKRKGLSPIISQRAKEQWADPERRERIMSGILGASSRKSATLSKTWKDPEIRQRRIAGLLRAWANPEVKERMRAAVKAAWVRRKGISI